MAKLGEEKAKELLEKPRNKVEIDNAIRHQERLFLHTQAVLEQSKLPFISYQNWIDWCGSFLDPDKMGTFKKMVRLPLTTVDLSESIFNQLKKFQQAKDKFVKLEFTSSEYHSEFTEYLEEMEFFDFLPTKGFNSIKSSICSLVVIDMPDTQTTPRPQPYAYLLDIDNVLDIERHHKTGNIEYVIFQESKNKRICIDEENYFVFEKLNQDWQLTSISQHSFYNEAGQLIDGLGWTPVCFMFDEPIPKSNGINQKSPLTNALSKLDWLLFWDTSKRYFDSYGSWPIIVSYKSACEYRDEKGNECVDGYIFDDAMPEGQKQQVCPKCSASKLIGPGSAWEVDPPRDKDEADIMQKPVNIIEVSNDKLEWVTKEKERLTQEIYFDCTGSQDVSILNQKQINEDQVKSQFETQQAVLDEIRTHFERTERFILETMARLMYGDDFIKCTVYGGNDYFLQSTDDILKEIEMGKKVGVPQYELGSLRKKYVSTKNRNNPDQLQRAEIMQNLEPYPDLTIAEMKNLGLDTLDQINFVLKINFNNFIERFEREFINILEFGSLIPFKTKISIINDKLKDYANEKISAMPPPESSGIERGSTS